MNVFFYCFRCSAIVGKVPNNANRVTLHENCFVKGIVLHELMHALGFTHEQNRPDRDEFVKIDFDNIRNGKIPETPFKITHCGQNVRYTV